MLKSVLVIALLNLRNRCIASFYSSFPVLIILLECLCSLVWLHTAQIQMRRTGTTLWRRRSKFCTSMEPKLAKSLCMWWRELREKLTNPASSSAWRSGMLASQVSCCPASAMLIASCRQVKPFVWVTKHTLIIEKEHSPLHLLNLHMHVFLQ